MDDPGVRDGKPNLLKASPRFSRVFNSAIRTRPYSSPISTGRKPCLPFGRNAMRRILFVLTLLAALVPTAGQSASAQVVALAPFSGYSTGTAVHAGALDNGTTRLVDSEIAFSGPNVNSAGLGAALSNEMAQAFQDVAKVGDKSARRGSGLEIGLASTVRDRT